MKRLLYGINISIHVSIFVLYYIFIVIFMKSKRYRKERIEKKRIYLFYALVEMNKSYSKSTLEHAMRINLMKLVNHNYKCYQKL